MTPGEAVSMELPSADSTESTLDSAHASAQELLHLLREGQATIGAAESLTGGLLSATMTDIAGASESVMGTVVSYSAEVKRHVLGVSGDLLERQGAVSPEVAGQMARGARSLLGCDYAVATTGVAGPDTAPGGTERAAVPVGEVYIAVVGPYGEWVERLHLTGSRVEIRQAAVRAALSLVTRQIRRDRLNEA